MMSRIVQVLLIVTLVYGSWACRCGIPEERDRYCQAEHASIVKVRNDGKIIANERVYKVSYIRRFKSVAGYNTVSQKIFTATSSAACGVLLDKNGIYLVAGNYLTNRYQRKEFLGLCSVVRKFKSLREALAFKPYACKDQPLMAAGEKTEEKMGIP